MGEGQWGMTIEVALTEIIDAGRPERFGKHGSAWYLSYVTQVANEALAAMRSGAPAERPPKTLAEYWWQQRGTDASPLDAEGEPKPMRSGAPPHQLSTPDETKSTTTTSDEALASARGVLAEARDAIEHIAAVTGWTPMGHVDERARSAIASIDAALETGEPLASQSSPYDEKALLAMTEPEAGQEQVGAPLDLTREEAEAVYECAWREEGVNWNPEFNRAAHRTGMAKLRAFLAGTPPEEDG